ANLDPSVKPGDNFWQYAVGGWLEANPLDKQHPENGAFTDLEELNKDRINELIMEYAGQQLPQGTDGQKIGSLYRLYMDSVARNNLGFEPIKPYLEQVRQLQTRDDLLKLMYEFDSKGFNTAPFGISLNLNPFNSSEFMMSVGHGGASLPQEYYADPNEQQAAVVAAIKSLNKDLLKMVGYTDEVAEQMMEAEWAIEHKIGVKTLDQVASRNPMATIHFMPWTQLLDEFKGIDWESYRAAINYPKDIDTVNVAQLDPLHEVEDVLANTSLDDLKAYMEIHVIKAYAGFLSDDFTDRMFEATKAIAGVQEQQPRWKRAVSTISGNLGETIGKLYVQKYFPETSKQRVVKLVKDLQQAFEDRLKENTWMSEATKQKALEKLHAMYINVGYPDKWEDLEKFIDIRENENLVENFIRINQEAEQAELRKYWRKPVDKTMMGMPPQTVNAFYNPMFNSINFPAAILQPPFFDPDVDYSSNYGAIGVVIGHEMTHGFDDQGCQYDKDGNLTNWWTPEDKANYDKRTKVVADWFSKQEAVPGLNVNGEKTLGENVSDNGGLKIAYRAYENRMKVEPLGTIDGFTPAQRFYLAYARVWASNSTPEYIAYIVNTDVHSPSRLRVNAALPMIDTWYDAFGIKKSAKMFIPKKQRALVW
ncbi:MAG: M13 family metallopeptidase, partial [Bacteroidaceae bacterium]|nr:M13 family metallopeptidase [Bacteroidaceae bacterium]